MSKIRIVLTALTAILAAHWAAAWTPAYGASNDEAMVNEPFYTGDSGLWVLMHDARNDGYQCSVSFVTTNGTYSIHGPVDPEMAKTGKGTLWFDSPSIPRTDNSTQRVMLAVHGNGGALNWPALQTTIGNAPHGTFMVAVQIMSVLKDKADMNDLSVSFAGKEVFRAQLVEQQKAYARLSECMAARSGN
ncbi:hypothetical protein PQR67_12980 [Paraburkholderia fungorum]|uniref:hypothetical protein n=1 Tax=Paraburkholderia fungorum TaxID=134537 RepID=UPI0038BB6284